MINNKNDAKDVKGLETEIKVSVSVINILDWMRNKGAGYSAEELRNMAEKAYQWIQEDNHKPASPNLQLQLSCSLLQSWLERRQRINEEHDFQIDDGLDGAIMNVIEYIREKEGV